MIPKIEGKRMRDMLEHFRKAQQAPVQRLLALEKKRTFPAAFAGKRLSFAASLKPGDGKAVFSVIAEYKRASPSKGVINLAAGPEETAALYASRGACAISVLTEEENFQGHLSYLPRMAQAGLPLLRKDFLIHPLQVAETAATPASALLLIVRMLDAPTLAAMLRRTLECGLEAVLEVFDPTDLQRAREALRETGAQPAIIQVNNRDLQFMRVDETVSRQLIKFRSDREIWISASGITGRPEVEERFSLGYDAVLAGTVLMSSRNPGETLAQLAGKILSD
jgi:indole-3-glycerol phosphate synthase